MPLPFSLNLTDTQTGFSAEEVLAKLLAHSAEGTFILDEEGQVSVWNAAMERLTGCPAHTVVGRRPVELLLLFPELGMQFSRVLADGTPLTLEQQAVTGIKDFNRFQLTLAPLGAAAGELAKGVLGILRPLATPVLSDKEAGTAARSEANKTAPAVRYQLMEEIAEPMIPEQLQQILDGLQVKYACLEPVYSTAGQLTDFTFRIINQRASEWFRRPDLAGQSLLKFWAGAELLLDSLAEVWQSGTPRAVEMRYANHGIDAWLQFSVMKTDGILLLLWEEVNNPALTLLEAGEGKRLIEHINQTLPMVVAVVDLPGEKLLYTNRDLSLQLGYRPQEARELQPGFVLNILHPDDVRQIGLMKRHMQSAKEWEAPHFQFRLRHKSGRWLWHEAHLKVYKRDEKGLVTEVLALVQEIDEARLTHEMLRGVLNTTPAGIIAFDAVRNEAGEFKDLEWRLINPQAEQLLGQRSRHLLGKTLSETTVPVLTEELQEKLINTLLTRKPLQLQHQVQAGPHEYWLEVQAIRVEDSLTVSLTDITDLKVHEKELQERQLLLQSIFDTAPFAIVLWSYPVGEIHYINRQLGSILGYPTVELAANQYSLLRDLIHPRDRELLPQLLNQVTTLNEGEQQRIELRIRAQDGEYRYLRVFNNVFRRDEGEQPVECLSILHDETYASKQESLLLQAQELVGFGIFERNLETQEIYWSEGLYQQLGYLPGELGLNLESVSELIHPDDREILADMSAAYTQLGQPITYRILHRDGSYRTLSGVRRILTDAKGKPVRLYGLVQDVTEQLRMNEEFQRTTELSLLSQLLPQMVFTQNEDHLTTYMNDQMLRYFGLTELEIRPEDWETFMHPDDRKPAMAAWGEAFQKGALFQLDLRLRDSRGVYRWHLVRSIPVTGRDGKIQRWYGTATDIQQVKENEERVELLNQMLSNSLLELNDTYKRATLINKELDQFVYRASYDLQAPLQNLEGMVNQMLYEVNSGAPAPQDLLQELEQAIGYFKGSFRDLTEVLKVERSFTEEPSKVGLAVLIENAKSALQEEIEANQATVKYELDTPSLTGVSSSLNLLVTRLLKVALQYPMAGQTPNVHFRSGTDDQGNLVITMETNNSVLDEHQVAMAFRLFHRSYRHIDGTGISLYPICQITEHLGGKAELHCTPGKGCTYRLVIPLLNSEPT